MHTDGWRGYDSLVNIGIDWHSYRGNNEFVRGSQHVNDMNPFWSCTKRRLVQFKAKALPGMPLLSI
jgi:hypothetical protein